ncbi:putative integral membrane protein [Rhodococcus phage E3]|uniref:putative integral membrane protein n=1 Tax=Rhodococcus phage E3 TaxID=1007869 RepID=UPI0002C69C56|nr:putative integral membrane protein [Rhodococcus phage E3]AEQ20958.1 putative integral membrane protein [Rhodococcus phage E3]
MREIPDLDELTDERWEQTKTRIMADRLQRHIEAQSGKQFWVSYSSVVYLANVLAYAMLALVVEVQYEPSQWLLVAIVLGGSVWGAVYCIRRERYWDRRVAKTHEDLEFAKKHLG